MTGLTSGRSIYDDRWDTEAEYDDDLDDLDPDDLPDFDLSDDGDSEDDIPWWRSRPTSKDKRSAKSRGDYLGGLWGHYGFKSYGIGESRDSVGRNADNILVAHAMAKTFVDTFGSGAERFDVTFDPKVATAGTNFTGKKVVISPAPILDPTIDSEMAGRVLTAMATHEAAHIKYGSSTNAAIRKAFPDDWAAARISNVLADLHDEGSFARDYPGYADNFAPAIDYVAGSQLKDGQLWKAQGHEPIQVAIAALRYPHHADWTGAEDQKAWWEAWADRWALKAGRPKDHVEAVREALIYAGSQVMTPPPDLTAPGPQGQGNSGSGQGQSTGQDQGQGSGDDGDQDGADQGGSKSQEGSASEGSETGSSSQSGSGASTGGGTSLGGSESDTGGNTGESSSPVAGIDEMAARQALQKTLEEAIRNQSDEAKGLSEECLADAIVNAAVDNGVRRDRIDGTAAQEIVNDDKNMAQVELKHGFYGQSKFKVDVRRAIQVGAPGARSFRSVPPSGQAVSTIRQAFMRSRSGHTGKESGHKRGRLDSGSLYRIAMNDARLFHRRNAPDPGKYLLWVLVDQSGSMNGKPTEDVIAMSKALAGAVRAMGNVRAEVFGWTTPVARGKAGGRKASQVAYAGVYSVWKTGEPVDFVDRLSWLTGGGTPDALALGWATKAIQKARASDEQPIIVMMSDGFGYGVEIMKPIVEEAVKDGIKMVGMAIGGSGYGGTDVVGDMNAAIYGERLTVRWKGSILATARPLAQLLSKLMAPK